MKSSFSKITTGLALLTACGGLNSCRLFGGGEYASQMEVETEVPESLEQGKPSQGPAAGQTALYASNAGVPATSNLTEVPDPYPPSSQLPSLPGSQGTLSFAPAGGASLTSLPADSSRDLIDIPKPEFSSISVHSTRPPAEMLSLGAPLKPATRMSLGSPTPSGAYTVGVVKEKVEPLSSTPPDAEIASAPKALKGEPSPVASTEPGIPLLLGGARLSDFYQALHQPLLESPVVANQIPADSASLAASAEELSVPPPPPPADPPPGQ